MTRPQWLINVINYFIDHIFDFLTIAAALYVFARHQFQPYGLGDLPELLSWIIGILGLLTVSGMWERQRRLAVIEHNTAATRDLVMQKLGGPARSSDFFWREERRIGAADLAQATEIGVLGMVLGRTVRDNLSIFEERVKAGAHLRFLVLNPQSTEIMAIMPHRSYGTRNGDWWRERIQQTIGHIEDIITEPGSPGTIELGLLPCFSSFGLWLIDPGKSTGRIVVEIYHHRTADRNPTFELRPEEDAYWYGVFKQQFDLLWNACEATGNTRIIYSTSQANKKPAP